jgi:hypothetical protein
MRWWIGRALQVAGLGISGVGCVLAFWKDTTEGQFIVLGFGGFAIFWIGCRLLGVSQA